MPGPQEFRHGHAVVIGIGDDLPETVTDATGVAQLLTDPQRCGYPAGQVELLVGDAKPPKKRPTRQNILEALDRLADRCRADPDAIALVYYSGHGEIRREDDVYHLIPTGFDDDRFAETAVTGDEFAAKLRAVKSKGMLVLLDCCHAGGFSGGALGRKARPRRASIPPDLAALKGMAGRAVVASCQANEYSHVGTPYSIFTAALLEGLAGYGARQHDGRAYFMDVLSWIGHEVPKRSPEPQHPVLDFHQVPVHFPLAFYSGGDPRPKSLEWSGPVPPPIAAPSFESRPLPPLPESVRLIEALCDLTEGQLAATARALGIKPADLPRADLRSQAVEVHRIADRDRTGERLQLLRALILNYNPDAFQEP
ncbi:MAG: caspase family protein [Isosphaeraceae bacterium]